MLGKRLHDTVSRGRDGRILERELQILFASAALSVLPQNYDVCPDVGPVSVWQINRRYLDVVSELEDLYSDTRCWRGSVNQINMFFTDLFTLPLP